MKYQQLQKEIKKSGVVIKGDTRGSFSASPFQAPPVAKSTSVDAAPQKSHGAVKSRINTGLSDAPSSARSSASQRQFERNLERHMDNQPPLRKKMSFKERRESFKEQTTRDGSKSARQAAAINSLQKPSSKGISNLRESRASSARQPDREKNKKLSEDIESLERDVKVNLAGNSTSKKRQFLTVSQPNETVKPKAEPDEQYLFSASQPDTVIEEPDLEGSD